MTAPSLWITCGASVRNLHRNPASSESRLDTRHGCSSNESAKLLLLQYMRIPLSAVRKSRPTDAKTRLLWNETVRRGWPTAGSIKPRGLPESPRDRTRRACRTDRSIAARGPVVGGVCVAARVKQVERRQHGYRRYGWLSGMTFGSHVGGSAALPDVVPSGPRVARAQAFPERIAWVRIRRALLHAFDGRISAPGPHEPNYHQRMTGTMLV